MLTAARTEELLQRFRALRVLVAGDLMLDEFLWGNVSRISPEAPVPVVEVVLCGRSGQRGAQSGGVYAGRERDGPVRGG